MGNKQPSWYLVMHPRFAEERSRLVTKFQGQVGRKIADLMQDPRPGGSKTQLKSYPGLYRARAGDYRIIYRFNESVIELLTLRRRDDRTYDDLDELEKNLLEGLCAPAMPESSKPSLDWEAKVKEWIAERPSKAKRLPDRITQGMLEDLCIPAEYWQVLLDVETEEQLLSCDEVPGEYTYAILDRMLPNRAVPAEPLIPILEKRDIITPIVEELTGPLDAAEPEEQPMKHRTLVKSKAPALTPTTALVVRSSRKAQPMRRYEGNTAKGIGKETRYSVKLDGTIRLVFEVGPKEHALLTTDQHPELVDMVNEAKRFGGSSDGGAFIINEFRHVIVPTPDGHIFAGVYTRDLEFEFEGERISPIAPPNIKPGDLWPGPHAGVKYTLAAGAKDVRFEYETKRRTIKQVCLTDFHDPEALNGLLTMLRKIKKDGGAIFVNEAREIFAPVDSGSGFERVYVGHLGKHPWFPEPK